MDKIVSYYNALEAVFPDNVFLAGSQALNIYALKLGIIAPEPHDYDFVGFYNLIDLQPPNIIEVELSTGPQTLYSSGKTSRQVSYQDEQGEKIIDYLQLSIRKLSYHVIELDGHLVKVVSPTYLRNAYLDDDDIGLGSNEELTATRLRKLAIAEEIIANLEITIQEQKISSSKNKIEREIRDQEDFYTALGSTSRLNFGSPSSPFETGYARSPRAPSYSQPNFDD